MRPEINVANNLIAWGQYDEAIKTLKKMVEKTDKDGETKALVFILMAKALCYQQKSADAKRCLEVSCGILEKKEEASPLRVAEAYTEISMLYELMNESETTISLLKRSLTMLERIPQEQHMLGNVTAKIGFLLLLTGKATKAVTYLESAAERMKESFGSKHSEVANIYNNLGVAYMQLDRKHMGAQMFALAKDIRDVALGPNHANTIQTCQSLENAYSAMRSYPIALEFQQQVIDAWRSHGPSAADELREATQLLEHLKKNFFVSL